MMLNTTPTPAPEDVDPQELQQLLTAVRRAHKPGVCLSTVLAGIVATGSLMGIDFTQERDYAEPLLLSGHSVRILETA
jgi:hypothetical protein